MVDLQVTSHHADSRQRGGKKKNKNNKLNVKATEGSVFNRAGGTTLETNEALFEAIAFLLEIQSAVGSFLLLLFISISN